MYNTRESKNERRNIMKSKQVIGIVVAGLVFVFVSVSSVVSNYVSKEIMGETGSSLDMMASMMETSVANEFPLNPFVGVVTVDGTIMGNSTETSLFGTVGYDHNKTIEYVDALIDDANNEGILLYVNTPGGAVYETDELYLKLMEYKEKTERPIWTYMGNQACSGGYYIAMASDQILANRNCWTGSIGVIISMYNYAELFEKVGIKEIDITSGANKAMGSGGLEMTKEQEEILQSLVDESYDQFVDIVAKGRNMTAADVKPIADGRIYTAKQALDLNLIDGIESYEDAQAKFLDQFTYDVELYEPSEKAGDVFSYLFSKIEGIQPKSDAQMLQEMLESEGSGVPMYYAEPGK